MDNLEWIGWVGTILVLTGYLLNAKKHHKFAMLTWVFGDAIWIVYDIYIDNISHLVLSLVIILLNLYGIYNILKEQHDV